MDDIYPEASGLLFEITDRIVVGSVTEGGPKGRHPVRVAMEQVGIYLGARSAEDHYIEFSYEGRDYVVSSTERNGE